MVHTAQATQMLITPNKRLLQFTFCTGPQLSVHGVQTCQPGLAHLQSVKNECYLC